MTTFLQKLLKLMNLDEHKFGHGKLGHDILISSAHVLPKVMNFPWQMVYFTMVDQKYRSYVLLTDLFAVAAMASAALEAAFSAMDSNNDGVITREEFMAAQRRQSGRPPLGPVAGQKNTKRSGFAPYHCGL